MKSSHAHFAVLSLLAGKTVDEHGHAIAPTRVHVDYASEKGTGHKPQFIGRIAIHERWIVGDDPARSARDRYGRLLAIM